MPRHHRNARRVARPGRTAGGRGSRRRGRRALARLRAQGRVLEMGVDELALDEEEAILVLARAGVVVSRRKATEIARLTEGWAAGVYLAALSLKARAAEGATRFKFSGNHRLVRDYLRLELISRLDDEDQILTRTSVLDRICGSLCDGLVERDDSAAVIESLEQSQLLVVPPRLGARVVSLSQSVSPDAARRARQA